MSPVEAACLRHAVLEIEVPLADGAHFSAVNRVEDVAAEESPGAGSVDVYVRTLFTHDGETRIDDDANLLIGYFGRVRPRFGFTPRRDHCTKLRLAIAQILRHALRVRLATTVRRWLATLLPWFYLATMVFGAGACIGWLWCEEIFGWWVAPFREFLESEGVRWRSASAAQLGISPITLVIRVEIAFLSGVLAFLPFGFYALWRGMTRSAQGVGRGFGALYVLCASGVFAAWIWFNWRFIWPLFSVTTLKDAPAVSTTLPSIQDYFTVTERLVFYTAPGLELPILLVWLLVARVIRTEDLVQRASLVVLGGTGLALLTGARDSFTLMLFVCSVLLPYGAVTLGAFLFTRRDKLLAPRLL